MNNLVQLTTADSLPEVDQVRQIAHRVTQGESLQPEDIQALQRVVARYVTALQTGVMTGDVATKASAIAELAGGSVLQDEERQAISSLLRGLESPQDVRAVLSELETQHGLSVGQLIGKACDPYDAALMQQLAPALDGPHKATAIQQLTAMPLSPDRAQAVSCLLGSETTEQGRLGLLQELGTRGVTLDQIAGRLADAQDRQAFQVACRPLAVLAALPADLVPAPKLAEFKGALESLAQTGRLNDGLSRDLARLVTTSQTPLHDRIDPFTLLNDTVKDLANPCRINQGQWGTCAATCVQISLALRDPCRYVQVVAALAHPEPDHAEQLLVGLKRPSDQDLDKTDQLLNPAKGVVTGSGGRSLTTRLISPAFMNYASGGAYHTEEDVHKQPRGNHSGLTSEESAHLITGALGMQVENVNIRRFADQTTEVPFDRTLEARLDQAAVAGPVPVGLKWGSGAHAVLFVSKIVAADGREMALLINPWGERHSLPMSEFRARLTDIQFPAADQAPIPHPQGAKDLTIYPELAPRRLADGSSCLNNCPSLSRLPQPQQAALTKLFDDHRLSSSLATTLEGVMVGNNLNGPRCEALLAVAARFGDQSNLESRLEAQLKNFACISVNWPNFAQLPPDTQQAAYAFLGQHNLPEAAVYLLQSIPENRLAGALEGWRQSPPVNPSQELRLAVCDGIPGLANHQAARAFIGEHQAVTPFVITMVLKPMQQAQVLDDQSLAFMSRVTGQGEFKLEAEGKFVLKLASLDQQVRHQVLHLAGSLDEQGRTMLLAFRRLPDFPDLLTRLAQLPAADLPQALRGAQFDQVQALAAMPDALRDAARAFVCSAAAPVGDVIAVLADLRASNLLDDQSLGRLRAVAARGGSLGDHRETLKALGAVTDQARGAVLDLLVEKGVTFDEDLCRSLTTLSTGPGFTELLADLANKGTPQEIVTAVRATIYDRSDQAAALPPDDAARVRPYLTGGRLPLAIGLDTVATLTGAHQLDDRSLARLLSGDNFRKIGAYNYGFFVASQLKNATALVGVTEPPREQVLDMLADLHIEADRALVGQLTSLAAAGLLTRPELTRLADGDADALPKWCEDMVKCEATIASEIPQLRDLARDVIRAAGLPNKVANALGNLAQHGQVSEGLLRQIQADLQQGQFDVESQLSNFAKWAEYIPQQSREQVQLLLYDKGIPLSQRTYDGLTKLSTRPNFAELLTDLAAKTPQEVYNVIVAKR